MIFWRSLGPRRRTFALMDQPDPSLAQWLLDKSWVAMTALIGLVWKQNNDRLNDHKRQSADDLKRLEAEMMLQRGNVAKIFDKLEQHSQRAEDRHHELLTALHSGLAAKADK